MNSSEKTAEEVVQLKKQQETIHTIMINPPERTLRFEISKKMPLILLYWFAAQQQTSSLRSQKSPSIYSKFSVELSELPPSFQNAQEVA